MSSQRLALFPIRDVEVWDLYKKHQACYWITEEIDFSKDKLHYSQLKPDEQTFIQHIIAFFSISDTLVGNNIMDNFANNPANNLEMNCFYGFQTMMENIHSETYSMQIESIIDDYKVKEKLFDAVNNFPSIEKKAKWIIAYTDNDPLTISYKERLLAFVLVEGLFFSASFCSIYCFKQRGLMPGLTTSNEFIARDEGLHTNFGILLFNRINTGEGKMPREAILEIITDAVEIEKEFAIESLKVSIIGMNSELMSDYIEFVADTILINIGYETFYKTKNPFGFMDQISLPTKTNFFEGTVTQYSKASDTINFDDL